MVQSKDFRLTIIQNDRNYRPKEKKMEFLLKQLFFFAVMLEMESLLFIF